MAKLFLAAPFSDYLGPDGIFDRNHKCEIELLLKTLTASGYEVFSAHVREKWGEDLFPAELCTPLDFEALKSADVIIALPGKSGGVHVELGWASALGKPIILWIEERSRYSPLVFGLPTVTHTHLIKYDPHSLEVALAETLSWLAQIASI